MSPMFRQSGRLAVGIPMLVALTLGGLMASGSSTAAAHSRTAAVASHIGGSTCSGFLPPGTVAGIAATPDDGGYWIADGTADVVQCGDASGFGSLGIVPRQSVVGIAATPDGGGFFLV